MSHLAKLAPLADFLTWFMGLALPAIAALIVLALVLYGVLIRNWEGLRQVMPRNLALAAMIAITGLAMHPLHRRAERWHHAESYAAAAQVETLLGQGQLGKALALRATMTEDTPARRSLDRHVEEDLPRFLTRAIALANQGDYLAAMDLAKALPEDGPLAKKRARVLLLWAPYASLQTQRETHARQQTLQVDTRPLQPTMDAYDRLVAEIMDRALHLDPAALAHVNGKQAHPLAAALLAASVRARQLETQALAIPVPKGTATAARTDLATAISALKRGCEESLAYANSADPAPAKRAAIAFDEAKARRAHLTRLLQADPTANEQATPPASPSPSPFTGGEA